MHPQRTLKSLSESHLLTDRHLDSSLKSGEEVTRMKDELNKTKTSLQSAETQLAGSLETLDTERKQWSVKESELKKQVSTFQCQRKHCNS